MRKRRIKRRFKSIGIGFFELYIFDEVLKRRQHNFRSKRKRARYGPRGDGSIVRSIWNAASDVVKKLNLAAAHGCLRRARAVTCGEPPTKSAVSCKILRV